MDTETTHTYIHNMRIKIVPAILCLLAAAALPLRAANPHIPVSSGTVDVKTGNTALTLDQQFVTTLNTAAISLKKVIPGKIKPGKGELNFPVSGGAFDLADTKSEIVHGGGITFVANGVTVAISELILTSPASTDTTTTPGISALITVNGALSGRVDLMAVDFSSITAPFTLPRNKTVVLSNLPLKLTADGATALNTAFSTTVFTPDMVVGTATVKAITGREDL